MAMTRDERNKRRADLRFQSQHSSYMSFKSSYLELWLRAKRDKMTHTAMLAYRSEWIMGTEAYKKLPLSTVERLTGVWDVLQDLAYRQDLVHCYDHPDTGIPTDGKVLCDAGLANRIDGETGGHYWKNDDGTFTHPFSTRGTRVA